MAINAQAQAAAQAAAQAKAQAAAQALAKKQADEKAKADALAKQQQLKQQELARQQLLKEQQAQAKAEADAKARAAAQAKAQAAADAKAKAAADAAAYKLAQQQAPIKRQQDKYLIDYARSVNPNTNLNFDDFLRYQQYADLQAKTPISAGQVSFSDYLNGVRNPADPPQKLTATANQNLESDFFNKYNPTQQKQYLMQASKDPKISSLYNNPYDRSLRSSPNFSYNNPNFDIGIPTTSGPQYGGGTPPEYATKTLPDATKTLPTYKRGGKIKAMPIKKSQKSEGKIDLNNCKVSTASKGKRNNNW